MAHSQADLTTPPLFSFFWISFLIVFILTSHLAFPMARESSSYCLTCYLCPPKITLFTICSAFYIDSPGKQLYSYEFHFLQGINLLPILSLGFCLDSYSSLLLFRTPNKNLLWVQSLSWPGLLESAVTLNVFNRRAFPCSFYLLDVCLHSVLEYFGPITLFFGLSMNKVRATLPSSPYG